MDDHIARTYLNAFCQSSMRFADTQLDRETAWLTHPIGAGGLPLNLVASRAKRLDRMHEPQWLHIKHSIT